MSACKTSGKRLCGGLLVGQIALLAVLEASCSGSSSMTGGNGLSRRIKLGEGSDSALPQPSPDTPTSPEVNGTVVRTDNCQADTQNTFKTKSGVLEYGSPDFKPGVFGDPSALTGADWPNGGTNKPRGDGPARLDWRLCPKIAFYERGHSLTRTIAFEDPAADGDYQLTVHRVRNPDESYGIGIWYHVDERVQWNGAALHNFNKHQDYVVTCNFKAAGPVKWTCSYVEQPQTAIDCGKWTRGGVQCTKIELAQ